MLPEGIAGVGRNPCNGGRGGGVLTPMTSIEQLLEHSGWARRLAAGLVPDASRADDAVQDAWVAALAHPPAHAENLKSWFAFLVKRAARRSARGDARRTRRDRAASKPEATGPAADALERAELQRTLVDAVLALREPYKTAIVLAYFEELPPRKIARRLSLPATTVRSHIRRGLALLREDLEAKTDDRETLISAIAALARGPNASSAPPWTAGAASTGGLIVMTKTKIAVATIVLAAAGVLIWMRGSPSSTESTTTGERSPVLSLARVPKADSLQSPSAEPSRSEAPIEAVVTSAAGLPATDDEALLRGRVVDGKGAPVPGADVRVLRAEARTYTYVPDMDYQGLETRIAETSSDASGEFSVRLPRGRAHDLRVRSPEFAERQMSAVHAGETVVVTLHPAAVLTGFVKRVADGAPIAGALLVVESEEGYEPMWQGKTDAGGHYRAEGLDAGAAHVLVIPVEQRSKYFPLELKPGEQTVQDFEIQEGCTVEGFVRDHTTEAPIVGAELSSWSFLHQTVRTDTTGHFVLHGLKDIASAQIQARAEGYGLSEMRVPAKEGDTVHADFELLPARSARGRVITREGAPVAGAYVAALASGFDREQKISRGDWRPSRSAEDGTFELRNLRPDQPHALFLRKEGCATTILEFGEGEKSGATQIALGDVVLPRMSTLSGRIVDAEGRGIAAAGIEVHQPRRDASIQTEGFTMQSAASDDEGRFRLLDLPSGELSLTVTKTGLPSIENLGVELAEGEARRDFTIRMGGGLSLHGLVLDPEGAGARGARVYVSGGSLSTTSWHLAVAESDGGFVFSGLAPGEYSLRAEPRWDGPGAEGDDWIASRSESVRAGATDVVLQLQHGVAIEGRLSTPEGSPAARAWIVAFESSGARVRWTVTDEKGVFRLEAGSGTTVELRLWTAKADPQSYWGYSADESSPPIAVVPGVRAGTKDLVVPVPR